MHPLLVNDPLIPAIPIYAVHTGNWAEITGAFSLAQQRFLAKQGCDPQKGALPVGKIIPLPDTEGDIASVLFCVGNESALQEDPFLFGKLPDLLPTGVYQLAGVACQFLQLAVLAWLLGAYRFSRYRDNAAPTAQLYLPAEIDAEEVTRLAEAVSLGRDLINTPANDLGPAELEEAAQTLALRYGARFSTIEGDALLTANYPLIHAVGRASSQAPRLIEIAAGEEDWPKVTIVGKGVTFDTGGLDIKPSSAMLLMKKDMGGAAAALATAQLLLDARVKVRLRVLIPAVENSVSGCSFRPGDVLPSRKGLSIEIGDTDAEGRLVLADALTAACEDDPDLIIDFATLTGAARVALGPELPPFYTESDAIASDLVRIGIEVNDPVWRLPLWPSYDKMLSSKVADINNVSSGGFAGSITAALFLRRFTQGKRHVHFDIYGWTPSSKPGRPEGGEVQGARLVYAWLKQRYGSV